MRRRGGSEVVLEEIRLVIFFKLYIDGMTDDDEDDYVCGRVGFCTRIFDA